jgi:transposase
MKKNTKAMEKGHSEVQDKIAGKLTVGIDLGDKISRVCVLDQEGEIIEESSVKTTDGALRQRFAAMSSTRVAIEAGAHSPWVSRLLEGCGHEVLVANARKMRLIYENDRKCDRVDAESLARLARLDPKLLAPIHHRDASRQADLAVIRARAAVVAARTQLINAMRGMVKAMGGRLPSCSTKSFHLKVDSAIPESLRLALEPLLAEISSLTESIRSYDRQIEELAQTKYPETAVLRQVTGVGALTALSFVLTLEDPRRFSRSRDVGAYLGLRPKHRESGNSSPQLGITKAGDRDLRRLLVQSAHYILGPFGPDTDLRRWGLKLTERGGKNAKKRALVAAARKLAVLLHRLWVTGEVYEPLREAHPKQALEAA